MSDNTIGAQTTGGSSSPAANVIGFNTNAGVLILSGTGNAVNANTYYGTNGSCSRRRLWPPATSGWASGPTAISSPGDRLRIALGRRPDALAALVAKVSTTTVLDVYLFATTHRIFLGETTIAANAFSGSLSVSGVTTGSQIVATQTVGVDGTSAFSAPVSVVARVDGHEHQ